MRTSIRIAALLLSGAMFIGCDNKDNTTVAPPPATPPAVPNTSQVTDAAKKMADTAKTDAKNVANTASTDMKNAVDATKNALPTSMPSMPAMPK
jgi:hypothetical protein